MPNNPIDHTRLLTENFRGNLLWTGLTSALNQLINPNVQGAVEQLQQMRYPDVEPVYANLSTRMLGFRIPSLAFTPEEYNRVLRTLGTFWQTRGAHKVFIDYLSFIKNVELVFVDLWANSLDMPIEQLVQNHSTEVWNGGVWFPTSFFDVIYSKQQFPDLDDALFRNFIYQLAPEHLVLRDLVGIEASTTSLYISAIPLDRQTIVGGIARPLNS